jgi:hypothetical protein
MTTKLPADLARERLTKRDMEQLALVNKITPKSLQKTPSQRRSESGRKKYLKRAGKSGVAGTENVPDDCNHCPEKSLPCPKLLEFCGKKHMILRCGKCKQRVRVRVDPEHVWELCPVCSEGKA